MERILMSLTNEKVQLYNTKNENTMQPKYKKLYLNKGTLGTVL